MADEKQLKILQLGVADWNAWRSHHPDEQIDLGNADLRKAKLDGANLDAAFLSEADLRGADLRGATLSQAYLGWAKLNGADLSGTELTGAYFGDADLYGANLFWANLRAATLDGADLGSTALLETILPDLDLSKCRGLESCHHAGPSIVDIRTLQRSGPLPLAFLRGVGLPDTLIDYLPSLLNPAIQMYSCFISYSTMDKEFAERLHADLQGKSVRCWFAPHDMKIGAKLLDTIDDAIRLRDKLLLVLSKASIESEWVEDEVTKAFEEERRRGSTVLFPIRLDDVVFTTGEAWVSKLRAGRHIGDFRGWKEHDSYRKAFDRLLRDLRIEKA